MTQRRDDWADACCHTLHGQPVPLRRSEMYEGALEAGWSEEDAEAAAINVIMFFFYHEVGRGLVDVLSLPITGKEEDAVDQLSTFALSLDPGDGATTALDAALAFMAWAQEREAAVGEAVVWGEHSLNEQRYFNIVCWVSGGIPSASTTSSRTACCPRAARRSVPGSGPRSTTAGIRC